MDIEMPVARDDKGVVVSFKDKDYYPASSGRLSYKLTPKELRSNYQNGDISWGDENYPGELNETLCILGKADAIDTVHKVSLLESKEIIKNVNFVIRVTEQIEWANLTFWDNEEHVFPNRPDFRQEGILEINLQGKRFDALLQKIKTNKTLNISVFINLRAAPALWTDFNYYEGYESQRLVFLDSSKINIPEELKDYFDEYQNPFNSRIAFQLVISEDI